jgi:imidazolonepropionase-like amidohydrolase
LRVVGEFNGLDLYVRRAVEEGVIPGPRLLVAGSPLTSSNGHGLGTIVDGEDAVRRAVRTNLHAGVDLIKIFVTGGLASLETSLDYCGFTEREVRAAVEEAHRGGKRVAAHAQGGDGIAMALSAGADTIEHGTSLSKREVELFLATDAMLVCTYALLLHPDGLERRFGSSGVRERVLAARETAPRSFAQVVEAGVRYAVGTDNMIGHIGYELQCLVRFGATPMQAIVAATSNGARALGLADRLGTLEPGKIADIISVEGDPVSDLTSLYNVRLIMRGGRRFDTLSEL